MSRTNGKGRAHRVRPFILAASLSCASAALAQESGLIIDRDRTDRHAPNVEPHRRPELGARHVETQSRTVAPFTLRGVRVDGASLPPAAFDAAVASLLGQSFDGASLHRIAEAASRAYADGSIALYTITVPEQDFADGVVHLQAIEGHVSSVAIRGDVSGNVDLVRAYAAGLNAERPLRRATLERQLSLISDIPGLETRVSMAPSADYGGVGLGLDLKQKRWDYTIGLDNRGSAALGRTQVSASLTRNGLFRLGEQTQATIASDSDFDRLFYAALSHREPIGNKGDALIASVSALETRPDNGVNGSARTASLVYTRPLIRSYQRNLTFALGLDGVNSDNATLGDVIASERTRVTRASLAFSDAQPRRAYSVSGTISHGFDALGARATDPGTSLDFSKLNLQAGYNRVIGRSFVIRLAAAGQASGQPLPASERFALGGASFGRAFEAASLLGDEGVGGSAELAFRPGHGVVSEVYGFTDGGKIWVKNRPTLQGASYDLASAGVGVRLALGRNALDLEVAKPVDEPLPGAPTGGWRFRFGVRF